MDDLTLEFILNQFEININNVNIKPINQGYINDTFLVQNNNQSEYILQRVNTNVFKNPEILLISVISC